MATIASGGSKSKLPPKVPSSYNVQSIQSYKAPTVPRLSYNVQDIQKTSRSRATPLDVPYEQFKANVDVQRPGEPIEQPLRYDTQAIQSTPRTPAPVDIGGDMTPGEATAAGWYGVSTAVWREDKQSMDLRAAGKTPIYGADLAAQATANYINNFGWPSFITPYVTNALGLSDDEMGELGYVQDPGGHWVRTERSAPSYAGGGTITGDASVPRYSYSQGGGYGNSIAGRAGGLINWRIGF